MDNEESILILGGGAWGLSTALHLLETGRSNITIFDRADSLPSPYSAAFDLNKIVRAEYEDPFYTNLALEAINAWKQPLFGRHYHETGYIVATTDKAPAKATAYLHKSRESVAKHPVFAPAITSLNSPDALRKIAWQFNGPLTGFTGYFNRLAGYAHSANAMKDLGAYLSGKGVKFMLGHDTGRVTELLYTPQGSQKRCIGIRTADGRCHKANLVVVALGAWCAQLLPEVGHSVVAKCWSVAHVQLSKEECDYLRFIPTTNIRDLGFFFEPDPETRLFKLCPLGAGFTNKTTKTDSGAVISLPPNEKILPPQNFIPAEDEAKLRRLLHEVFPWMENRPFIDQRLCWFADTQDSDYCIDFVPNTNKSVIVMTGDSGHGFKMMPIVGKWILNLLNEGAQTEYRWRWRNVRQVSQAWDSNVSWRVGESRELRDIIAEKARLERARL